MRILEWSYGSPEASLGHISSLIHAFGSVQLEVIPYRARRTIHRIASNYCENYCHCQPVCSTVLRLRNSHIFCFGYSIFPSATYLQYANEAYKYLNATDRILFELRPIAYKICKVCCLLLWMKGETILYKRRPAGWAGFGRIAKMQCREWISQSQWPQQQHPEWE